MRQNETTQKEMLRMQMRLREVAKKDMQLVDLDGRCHRVEQENGIYSKISSLPFDLNLPSRQGATFSGKIFITIIFIDLKL